jgi:hypothetical protein
VFWRQRLRESSSTVFVGWLKDSSTPKDFRDAGHFWGVAPGTPSRVVRQRAQAVEDTLDAALAVLQDKDIGEVGDNSGRRLYDETDIRRGLEFHRVMKDRFRSELAVLAGPESL